MQAWWIQAGRVGPGSSVILLAAAFIAASSGCGPDAFPGREGFTDTGPTGTGTETGPIELDTGTETETGDPECPELIASNNVSINSLEELEAIDGVTAIEGNFELAGQFGELEGGLEQLRCLESVAGFTYIHDNDLVDLVGLERLATIGDYLYIGQNFALQDFEGLAGLRSVGSFVHVTENPALLSTVGMGGLAEVGDFLHVTQNPQLQDLLGFASVDGVGGGLRIEANSALQSLAGLDNIRGVEGNLGVLANPQLADTSALENIERIGGNCLWQGNPQVSTLNLDSLLTIDGYLILDNLPSLQTLDDLFGLQGINSSLFIWETGLAQIDGLSDLAFIGGDVWIENNQELENIDGLSGITDVLGALRVDQNPNLTSAEGLANLVNASAGLSLWGNFNLSTVNLAKLEFVGEYLRIGYSPIEQMDAPALETIGGDLLVFGLDGPTSFTDLSSLTTIAGRLYYRDNPAIVEVSFPALTQVFGRVQFINNESLDNLDGLATVEVAQAVNIRENFSLKNIAGLSQLDAVPGMFKVIENEGLSSLGGLGQLQEIGGDFHIRDNLNLEQIPGFAGLAAVGGDVVISGNAELPTCTAQGIVDGLSFVGGVVDLSNNLADACSP